MSERDVAIRYALSYTDRGLARAVQTTRSLEEAVGRTGKAVDLSTRRQSDAWKLLDRQARAFDTDTSRRSLQQASAVSRSVSKQVEELRRLGASYKEISSVARAAGASAQQASALIEKSVAKETAAIERQTAAMERANRARASLRSIPGSLFRGGGGSAEERSFVRGAARGTVGRVRSVGAGIGGGLLGGLAGFVSVEGIKQATESTTAMVKQAQILHHYTGLSSQSALELEAVSTAYGVTSKSLGTSFRTLGTQVNTYLTNPTKASRREFHELGLTHREVAANSRDLGATFGLVADRLNKIPPGAERTALAAKLLGRNWQALAPLLAQGSKGMRDQMQEAKALGVQMGGDSTKNIERLHEAEIRLHLAQEGLSVQFTQHVAPALIKGTEGAIKLATAVGHDLSPAFKAAAPVVRDVGHWLAENKGVVIALAGAYAGLKIVRTVGGWFGGLYQDGKRAYDFMRGLFRLIAGQAGEADRAALSNDRLAASLEAIAASSRAATTGMEGLAGATAAEGGSGLILPRGAKSVEAGVAGGAKEGEVVASGLRSRIASDGLLAGLFGKSAATSIGTKAGTAVVGAEAAGDVAKAGGVLGKLGPALGATAKFLGPIGLGISALQGASAFIGTHGTLGERLQSVASSLTFGLVGPGVTNAHQRQQGMQRAGASWQRFGQDPSGLLTAAGIGQYQARIGQLQQQSQTAGGRIVQGAGGPVVVGKDDKVWLDRHAQIVSLTQAFTQEQRAALKAITATDSKAQGQSRWSNVTAQLRAITPGLDKLTGKFQDAGALSAIKYARGLEQQGRLPRGSTDRLIQDLEAKYPPLAAYLQQQGATSMRQLADTLRVNKVTASAKGLVGQVRDAFGWLPTYTETSGKNAAQKLSSVEGELKHIMQTGTQAQKDAAAPLLAQVVALHAQALDAIRKRYADDIGAARHQIRALGGDWNSLGSVIQTVTSSQILPSISQTVSGVTNLLGVASGLPGAAPSHGGHFAAGGWVVPGDSTRDGTLAWLSGREVVLTGPGQSMLEQHAPGLLDHVVRNQLPHFATGGTVAGVLNRPYPAHHTGTPGATLTPTQVAAVFEGAGLPGVTFAQIAKGESSYQPGIVEWPPEARTGAQGIGLSQITTHVGNDALIAAHGGPVAMRNPYVNAAVARVLYGRGGLSPWHGTRYLTDANAHYHGKVTATATGTSTSGRPGRTTFASAGAGLTGGFDAGYQFGLDPTSGMSPASALHAAMIGASLKAVHHPGTPATGPAGGFTVSPAKRSAARTGSATGLGSFGGVTMSKWIANELAWATARGWRGQPTSGYRPGAVTTSGKTSEHALINYPGGAVDFGAPVDPAAYAVKSRLVALAQRLNYPGPRLRMPLFKYNPGAIGGGDDGHLSGNGYRRGGRIRSFRTGGPPSQQWFANRAHQPTVPSSLGYHEIGSLSQAVALIPVQAITAGTRTALAAAHHLAAGLHQLEGSSNDAVVRRALTQIQNAIANVHRYSFGGLLKTADMLQGEIVRGDTSTRAGRREITRLKQALQLIDYRLGIRVGRVVKVAEDQASALQDGQSRLQRLMDRRGIDSASAQGASMLEAFDAQSVKVLRNTISRLQWAYRQAKRVGDKKAVDDITTKLKDALDSLDQAITDRITAHRTAIEAAAQGVVDRAGQGTAFAQASEQNLQLQQQLSGTAGTKAGGQQMADLINRAVVPALQGELGALQKQYAAAKSVGDQTLADQIAQSMWGKQGDILQAQLDAQTATKDATEQTAENTAQLVDGEIGVTFNGNSYAGDLAGLLNGA